MVPPELVRRVASTFDDAIAECLRVTACARGARDEARWRRALKQAQLPAGADGRAWADERGAAGRRIVVRLVGAVLGAVAALLPGARGRRPTTSFLPLSRRPFTARGLVR